MNKTKSIKVYGRVQNVGFRWATKQQADAMGIKGFVTNRYDGTVYIEASANDDKLDLFVTWCKQGPSHAYVSEAKVCDLPTKEFERFEIKR